jgi:hypothetical protein
MDERTTITDEEIETTGASEFRAEVGDMDTTDDSDTMDTDTDDTDSDSDSDADADADDA